MKSRRRTTVEVIEAMRASGGFLSLAAERLNMPITDINLRIEESPYLKSIMEEIEEQRLDLAEMALMKLIKAGNARATIFFLKCKGRARGYTEKQVVALEQNISHDDWVSILEKELEREGGRHEQSEPERTVHRVEGRGHEFRGDCQSAECIKANVD